MASDTADSLSWYMALPLAAKDQLGAIRHWHDLKVGFDDDTIWIKGFTPAQIDSLEVKTLLQRKLYFATGAQLYRQGSLLPDRSLPALLWTPIERGLPVRMPVFNHNYFGLNQSMSVQLKPTQQEQVSSAQLVSIDDLQHYIGTALSIRLNSISWVVVEENKALLIGTPPLPLPGRSFWRTKDFLFPAGYDLEFSILMDTLQESINPNGDCWIFWNEDGSWWAVPKADLTPLSGGSVQLTVNS